jgi:hypothetical protein
MLVLHYLGQNAFYRSLPIKWLKVAQPVQKKLHRLPNKVPMLTQSSFLTMQPSLSIPDKAALTEHPSMERKISLGNQTRP